MDYAAQAVAALAQGSQLRTTCTEHGALPAAVRLLQQGSKNVMLPAASIIRWVGEQLGSAVTVLNHIALRFKLLIFYL